MNAIALDDERPALEVIQAFCERIDLVTLLHTFTRTSEAHRFLDQQTIDLIFLDINMPGMSGWDFMEEYRKIDVAHKSKTIVVMLTTSLNPDDELMASANEEIRNYLHKPLNEDAFVKIAGKYFEEINN